MKGSRPFPRALVSLVLILENLRETQGLLLRRGLGFLLKGVTFKGSYRIQMWGHVWAIYLHYRVNIRQIWS